MVDGVDVRITGLEQTKYALEALAADLRRRVVRGALRAASRPLVTTAKQFAPVLKYPVKRRRAGVMRKAIRVFNSKKATGKGGVIGVYVTVRASSKDLRKAPVTGDPYYWRWVEGGHRVVARGKRIGTRFGKARYDTTLRERRRASMRKVAPKSFLQPAYRAKQQEVIRLFSEQVTARIAQANGIR